MLTEDDLISSTFGSPVSQPMCATSPTLRSVPRGCSTQGGADRLACEEGIFRSVSSGGSVAGALRLSATLNNAVIVAIVFDRGDRYLSTGVFNG